MTLPDVSKCVSLENLEEDSQGMRSAYDATFRYFIIITVDGYIDREKLLQGRTKTANNF